MIQFRKFHFLTKTFIKSLNFHRKTFNSSSIMSSNQVPLRKLLDVLEEFAPVSTAEKWDNVGLLVEPFNYGNVFKILLTNDLTVPVMEEAVKEKANFIITYHPIIFRPLKNIRQSDWKSRIISECLARGIAIYSPHTSWDVAENGVNTWLLETIGANFSESQPIKPLPDNPNMGAGKMCSLIEEISIGQAIENVKKNTGLSTVQLGLALGAKLNSKIKTVAVCAGSGGSVLSGVVADLYITGEMSHHEVLDAQHNGTTCILLNHSNSERQFLFRVEKFLWRYITGVPTVVSSFDADPLVSN